MLTRLLPLIASSLLLSTEAFAQQHPSSDRIVRQWRTLGRCLDATLRPPARSDCVRRSIGVLANNRSLRRQAWMMLNQWVAGHAPWPMPGQTRGCWSPSSSDRIGALRAVGGPGYKPVFEPTIESAFGSIPVDLLARFVRHLATTCEIVRPREALRGPPIWHRTSVVAAASPLPTP